MSNQIMSGVKRRRVRQVQSQAKLVGWLYLLGTIGLAVLAFFPGMKLFSGHWMEGISATNFWKPFADLFEGDIDWKHFAKQLDWYSLTVALLYGFVLVTVVVNALRSLAKLDMLMKKTPRAARACNRNARAMDKMGKIFSGSFAAIINFHLLIYVMSIEAKLTTYAYIILGVGLFVHFVAGLCGGKISLFVVGKKKMAEEKRLYNLFVYFIRNVLQLAAVAAIVYLIIPKGTLNQMFYLLFQSDLKNFFDAMLADKLVMTSMALQLVTVFFLMILIKHATASTEYNHWGVEGKGMKNFCIFALLAALTIGATFVVDYIDLPNGAKIPMHNVYGACIALAAFLLDLLIRSRKQKARKVDVDEEDEDDIFGDTSGSFLLSHTPEEYYEQYSEKLAADAKKEEVQKWEVSCPGCGKRLSARGGVEYHRCPACGKVFQLRFKDENGQN